MTLQQLYRESLIWWSLSHTYILKMEGVAYHDQDPLPRMVSPWIERGSIRRLLATLRIKGRRQASELVERIHIWVGTRRLNNTKYYKVESISIILAEGNFMWAYVPTP